MVATAVTVTTAASRGLVGGSGDGHRDGYVGPGVSPRDGGLTRLGEVDVGRAGVDHREAGDVFAAFAPGPAAALRLGRGREQQRDHERGDEHGEGTDATDQGHGLEPWAVGGKRTGATSGEPF